MKTPARWSAVALLVACASCVVEREVDLHGVWRGQWAAGSAAGTLEVTFSSERAFGDMTLYDVTVVVTGATCPSGEDRGSGDQTAAFRVDDVSFAVRMAGGAPGSEDNVFAFAGTLNGSREINGTFSRTSAACPACVCLLEGSGTWTVFR